MKTNFSQMFAITTIYSNVSVLTYILSGLKVSENKTKQEFYPADKFRLKQEQSYLC